MQWLPIITGIVTAILSTLVTVGSITLKLSNNMNRISEKAKEAAETVVATARISLAEHAQLNQQRHEDNLKEFRRIFVALARLGVKDINGPM